jgi:hypothetical protein
MCRSRTKGSRSERADTKQERDYTAPNVKRWKEQPTERVSWQEGEGQERFKAKRPLKEFLNECRNKVGNGQWFAEWRIQGKGDGIGIFESTSTCPWRAGLTAKVPEWIVLKYRSVVAVGAPPTLVLPLSSPHLGTPKVPAAMISRINYPRVPGIDPLKYGRLHPEVASDSTRRVMT